MTTRYDLSPTCFDIPAQDDLAALAPWMPLDELIELWAAFGHAARSAEALKATSFAFAALAHERAALHFTNRLHEGAIAHERPPSFGLPALVTDQQPIIESLTQAALHWFEAACPLSDAAHAPALEQDALPPGAGLKTLLGYTLLQRERVWTIAHSLLVAHLHPYHEFLAGGCGSTRADQATEQSSRGGDA